MLTTKKKMPVGVTDFAKLIRQGYYFVDKTGFIRDFWDNHADVTLITRPSRFGKTLTLSMLKYFFTCENAAENRLLFADKIISAAGESYMREQGTKYVVGLTLKDVYEEDYERCLQALANVVSEMYLKFSYLLDSPNLADSEKAYYTAALERKLDQVDLKISLRRLLKFINSHHHRLPILLIDEYDTPIIAAWERGYYQPCINFMRTFLGTALKDNEYLDFAVLTGVTKVSKESIFSGLNNMDVCGVLSASYDDAFGFTPEEAAKILTDCGFSQKLPELKKWYDGYVFGNNEIYNPWSVVKFIKEGCKFEPFWINTSGNSILREMLENVSRTIGEELGTLVQGGTVEIPENGNLVFDDLRFSRDALYTMLLNTGYLKAAKVTRKYDDLGVIELKIPNKEVLFAYKSEILRHISPHNGELAVRNMLHAMLEGDNEKFTERLSDIILDFVSFHDAAQSESFYHGLLLGFSVLLEGAYKVMSNRESGLGRFDIALAPKNNDNPAVILEIKFTRDESRLEKLAITARQQIEEKAYATELMRCGARKIWKYGIAICGKKIVVQGK